MPCLRKMHRSQRVGVKRAKERFGPSCSLALSVSFKNANWSKEGSPFGNTLKKKKNFTVIYYYQIPWLFKAKLNIYNSKPTLLFKKKEKKKVVLCRAGGGRISLYRIW